jgi:hypothetical protein
MNAVGEGACRIATIAMTTAALGMMVETIIGTLPTLVVVVPCAVVSLFIVQPSGGGGDDSGGAR